MLGNFLLVAISAGVAYAQTPSRNTDRERIHFPVPRLEQCQRFAVG